jgi:hypothetical protein
MLIAVPSTVALAAGQTAAPSAIRIQVRHARVGFGHNLAVTGSAPASDAGQTVQLQFARTGATRWQPVASTKIGRDGHFKLVTAARKSGRVRAVTNGAPAASPLAPAVPGATTPAATTSTLQASAPRPIVVASKFAVRQRSMSTLSGGVVRVAGHLLPRVRGRSVRLEGRSGGHWRLLATDRTGSLGGFNIRYRPRGTFGTGGEPLRVRFRGDRLNARSVHGAGKVTTFVQSVASWYYDAGSTACGFHAGLGVANKYLPCGTKVTFRYGGRSVTATVDDRGPYVGGRTWDFNQTTAHALGFGGVGSVWATS